MDFVVQVKATNSAKVRYQVVAEKQSVSNMENQYIRLYLQRSLNTINYNEEVLQPRAYTPLTSDNKYGAKKEEMILDEVTVSENRNYYYRLRMWPSSNMPMSSEAKTFKLKVNVYAKSE